MDDIRLVDHAEGFLAVDGFGVVFAGDAGFLIGGILAEIQEGLGVGGFHVVRRAEGFPVLVLGEEEFVVHGGQNAGLAVAVEVVNAFTRPCRSSGFLAAASPSKSPVKPREPTDAAHS